MFTLKQTCGGCPESYSVYQQDGTYVGHMRLRHGYFAVECSGVTVYAAQPNGDGIFEVEERDFYLKQGCSAIKEFLDRVPYVDYTIEYGG